VVLEIAENGSLLEFLKRHRSKNEGYEGEGTSPGGALPEDVKLRISLDVARGMAHLSRHRVRHHMQTLMNKTQKYACCIKVVAFACVCSK